MTHDDAIALIHVMKDVSFSVAINSFVTSLGFAAITLMLIGASRKKD